MKFREVAPNIIHVYFASRYAMTSALVRFQEYYESPKFRGKVFTKREVDQFFKANGLNYYSDVSGCNFPSFVLEPFLDGKFKRLSRKEKDFLAALSAKKPLRSRFYVIATAKNSDALTYKHETMHALYWASFRYRLGVWALLALLGRKLFPIFGYLKENLYDRSTYLDEVQAVLVCDRNELLDHGVQVKAWGCVPKLLDAWFKRCWKHYTDRG